MDDADPAPLIADPSGTTLWAAGGQKSYAHCRLQTYRGQPVITWWESPTTGLSAYAAGRDIVTDLDHHVIATIALHDGVSPDEHEFFLTPSNTALIVSYVSTPMDLSALGGATDGSVLNGIFEEIDVATGQVLHHWESLDHVGLDESYADVPTGADERYDYFHINSVKPTPDGEFLVSARHTWGIDKINPAGGGIRWRFGGKKTDFAIAHDARFAWQHDAQFEDATTPCACSTTAPTAPSPSPRRARSCGFGSTSWPRQPPSSGASPTRRRSAPRRWATPDVWTTAT